MMTMFLIGLGAIAVLIAITLWVDMPPIDEFGQRERSRGGWNGNAQMLKMRGKKAYQQIL